MINTFYGFPVEEIRIENNSYDGLPYGKMILNLDYEGIERIKYMSEFNINSGGLSMLWGDNYVSLKTVCGCGTSDKKLKEDKIIFNEKKKTTVVLWKDGTKTIVKASDNDTYDKRVGYLMAFYHKNCGMGKTKANKYIDSLCEDEVVEEKTTSSKYKIGDTVEIVGNFSGHRLEVGSLAKIKEIFDIGGKDDFRICSLDDENNIWYLSEDEFVKVNE